MGRLPAVTGGGPTVPKMEQAGKATGPLFGDSQVAEAKRILHNPWSMIDTGFLWRRKDEGRCSYKATDNQTEKGISMEAKFVGHNDQRILPLDIEEALREWLTNEAVIIGGRNHGIKHSGS